MNTIVMNTLTGAVSEYASFEFQSLTPTHAGSAAGLYLLGGDTDTGQAIVAAITPGRTLWSASKKKFIEAIYFSMIGTGTSKCTLASPTASYDYEFPVRSSGESRVKPGRGFRENYFDFTYSNPDGEAFKIDQIEVMEAQSTTRRI